MFVSASSISSEVRGRERKELLFVAVPAIAMNHFQMVVQIRHLCFRAKECMKKAETKKIVLFSKNVTIHIQHTSYILSSIFARFYEIRRTNRQIDIL